MTVDYLRAVQTTEIGMRFDNGELDTPCALP